MFKFAENLLNNLDQTTQSSIQTALKQKKEDEEISIPNKTKHSKNKSFTNGNSNNLLKNNFATTSLSTSSSTNNPTSYTSKSNVKILAANNENTSSKTKFNKDEEFISFLNGTEPKSSKTLALEKSEESTKNDVQFEVGSGKSNRQSDTEEDKNSNANESYEVKEIIEPIVVEDFDEYSALTNTEDNDDDEKKNLKKEIVLLNQEIQSLLKRVKNSQEEYQRSRRKVDNFQAQISESDKIIRELRSREEDLSESIKSKDSQLAILRVRYNENETELNLKIKEIELVRSESDRILKDHSNSSDMQSQAFETLKEKLKDLELNFIKEKEASSQIQKEYLSIQNKLEMEKHSLTESLRLLEKKLNDEKTRYSEMNATLKNSKTANDHLKQELDEYKLKAAKTLLAKDRVIATLKENSITNFDDSNQEIRTLKKEDVTLKFIEMEELKSEREFLKDELSTKTASIEVLRSEIMELELQTSIEIETLKDQQRNLIEQNEEQKQSKIYLEQDLKSLRQQLDFAQEELYKQKSISNNRLLEREAEIEKLRSQLTTKSLGTTTEKELENRLHLLTENLIQKQTLIEALQSEKHSIFLQLERSEKRLQDFENIVTSKSNSTSIRMNDEEEMTNNNKVPYLRETPYDHEVTRKVKRAVTEIDKFGIRLGVFLKKYPIARIFVLFYMFLLHIWVAIVLFTYTPEAHDSSFMKASVMPHMDHQ